MIYRIAIVFLFTLVIHLIATLAYSVRLVGVKTGRIAVSFALFNILVLVSRTANSFQAPLLAKVIENNSKQLTMQTRLHFLFLHGFLNEFVFKFFVLILSASVKRFNNSCFIP